MMEMERIDGMLTRAALCHPTLTAVAGMRVHLTYGQLLTEARRMSSCLAETGIGPGDSIFLFIPNSPEFAVAFFALSILGATVVPVDLKPGREVVTTARRVGRPFLLTTPVVRPTLAELFSGDDLMVFAGILLVDANLNLHVESVCPVPRKDCADGPYLPALILLTSGTTGEPKIVGLSHENLWHWARNYAETLGYLPGKRTVGLVPYFHSYGFGSSFLAAMYAGASLTTIEEFNPRKALRTLKSSNAEICHGTPLMYELMLEVADPRYDPNETILCISAGAPLGRHLAMDFYRRFGRVLHQEYGSTESCTVSVNLEPDPELNLVSVGRPLCNVRVRITNEQGEPVVGATEGRIEIQSKARAAFSAQGTVLEETEDGWFLMGDIGRLDEQGRIYITGRANRMMNIGGKKVFPEEIECLLGTHGEVGEVVVIGTPDASLHEGMTAFIVPRSAGERERDLVEELFALCRRELAPYKIPQRILPVPSLPRTGLGKIRLDALRNLFI